MKQLLGQDLPRLAWHEAEEARRDRELADMAAVAPQLKWSASATGTWAWHGELPLWPFKREMPRGLDNAVPTGMSVLILPSNAHPAVEPSVYPIKPEPSIAYRTLHAWHLRGDGSLCLLQVAADWTGRELCSQLAIKASGWYLEYLLLEAGLVPRMTPGGIAASAKYDAFLHRLVDRRGA